MLGTCDSSHGIPLSPLGSSGVVLISGAADACVFPCVSVEGKPGSLRAADWMVPYIRASHPVTYFSANVSCESSQFVIDCTGDNAVIVPHLKGFGALGEAFAGIGGWKFGLQFLQGKVKMSAQIDTETAQAFGRTHGVDILHIEEVWPAIKIGRLPEKDFILVADMADPRVWALASMLGINSWAMSPPCPPWSSSGNALGLQSRDGKLLTTVLDIAGKCGIHCIMIENVPNIVQHADFQEVKKVASQAGLTLVVSQIDDVAPVVPCNRKRWMAIFMSSSCVLSHSRIMEVVKLKWPRMLPGSTSPTYTLADADSVHVNIGRQELSELLPSELLCQMIEDPELLPPWQRKPGLSRDAVLKLRLIHGECVFKAIMASYGSQENLPIECLKKKGLHTFVVPILSDVSDCSSSYRLASPWELLAALGFPHHTILPVSSYKSRKVVGNALTPSHAALTGLRLHQILGCDSPFQPAHEQLNHFAKLFRDLATKLSGFCEARDSEWRWLISIGEAPVREIVKAEDVLDCIPPTVPFTCEEDIRIDGHGIAKPAPQMDLNSVLVRLVQDPAAAGHLALKHLPWVIAHADGLCCLAGWSPTPITVQQLLQKVWKHIDLNDIVAVTSNQKPKELHSRCDYEGTMLVVSLAKGTMIMSSILTLILR